jgi:hypothetical protein
MRNRKLKCKSADKSASAERKAKKPSFSLHLNYPNENLQEFNGLFIIARPDSRCSFSDTIFRFPSLTHCPDYAISKQIVSI